MNTTATALANTTSNLVSLPEVYFRANELLADPHSSAADLGEVIRHDPGLAARLLKIVNSSFYGFPAKVDTLPRAVALLGRDELRDLVLATVAVETFNKIAPSQVDMSTFWHHGVYCGLAARLLARRSSMLHTEALFVAGLLHDVGQLLIYQQLPALASQALADAELSDDGLYQAERRELGFTHAEVGAELFKAWGLPAILETTTRYHHEPAEAQDFELEAAIVHLANSSINAVEPGRNILDCQPVRDAAAWARTGLSEQVLEEVLAETETQFLDVVKIISPDAPLI